VESVPAVDTVAHTEPVGSDAVAVAKDLAEKHGVSSLREELKGGASEPAAEISAPQNAAHGDGQADVEAQGGRDIASDADLADAQDEPTSYSVSFFGSIWDLGSQARPTGEETLDTEAESESESESESGAGAGAESEYEAESGAESESGAEAESEYEAESGAEAGSDAGQESMPGSEAVHAGPVNPGPLATPAGMHFDVWPAHEDGWLTEEEAAPGSPVALDAEGPHLDLASLDRADSAPAPFGMEGRPAEADAELDLAVSQARFLARTTEQPQEIDVPLDSVGLPGVRLLAVTSFRPGEQPFVEVRETATVMDLTASARRDGGVTLTDGSGDYRWHLAANFHGEAREVRLPGTDWFLRYELEGAPVPRVVRASGRDVDSGSEIGRASCRERV
jgi:hypothetical protein